jgi:hypothetical protein
MSLTLLILLDFLFGLILYLTLQRFTRSARMVVTAVLMVLLAAFVEIVQNQEAVSYQWSLFSASWPSFAGKHQLNASDPAHRGSVADVEFQNISEGDRSFLNQILETPNQDGQNQRRSVGPESQRIDNQVALAINTAEVRRAELVIAKETVKRAQLVPRNETLKRAEIVRSRQQ